MSRRMKQSFRDKLRKNELIQPFLKMVPKLSVLHHFLIGRTSSNPPFCKIKISEASNSERSIKNGKVKRRTIEPIEPNLKGLCFSGRKKKVNKKKFIQKIQRRLSPHPSDPVVLYTAKALAKRYSSDNLSQLGGQLAYFFILSLFPFLMLVNHIISHFQLDILALGEQLQNFLPENMLAILESYLGYLAQSQSTGLFTFSVLSTIWLASKAITSLLYAMNRAFRSEKKITVAKQLISYLFTAITLVLIYLSVVFASVGKNLFQKFIYYFDLTRAGSVFGNISDGLFRSVRSFWRSWLCIISSPQEISPANTHFLVRSLL